MKRMGVYLLFMVWLFGSGLSIHTSFGAGDLKVRASDGKTTTSANMPWNWMGIVGTGQSLSVGARGNPAETDEQPYHNLKLSLGSLTEPPWDPDHSTLSMIPLVEPIRNYAYGYPSAYPRNIYGETPHTAMANQISKLASGLGMDYVTVHTVVGESGQGMSVIRKGATDKGTTGRAYAASLFEVQAIKRLAAKEGKTFGVSAVVITHGETDAGNTNYENDLRQMWSDYNTDIRAITGQSQKVLMFTNQQHSCPRDSGTSVSTLAQWKVGVDYPGDIVCTGPKYQYFYSSDGVHLSAGGYQQLGEKIGQVYFERVVLGHDWQPLQPICVVRTSSKVITVNFHVPVPPLVWDKTMPAPHQRSLTEWKKGKGFEVYTTGGKRIAIRSVAINGSSVVITCASPLPETGVKVGYAFTTDGDMRPNGTVRWGLLRDSDPFKGGTTGVTQPNFCVAFEMDVP